jgi:chromosome segregation ATPase
MSRLASEQTKQVEEVNELRGRANLSQQNWVKERDELIQREAMAREEFETAEQAMKEWESLANEERITRKNLADRVGDLEEELGAQREAYERAASERDTQGQTVEGLQRALKDIQDARKRELRDLVESSQIQLDALRKRLDTASGEASSAKATLEQTQAELERIQPLQQEIKEKNLLIGKLRHEAVTLNEHLTKALRFLKRSKPGESVDRQLVTNHLLQFLGMDRSDPKKFQVLQLIAQLLAWSEGKQSSLTRTSALTPVRRTKRASWFSEAWSRSNIDFVTPDTVKPIQTHA